ncbi:MAG: nuclear transport factor 2 family protein [Polyangiales bacterium]
MDPLEQRVLAANLAFYEAFAAADADAMLNLWSQHSPVACVHPGMPPLYGRTEVINSWRQIMAHPRAPRIHCTDAKVHILGAVAYVTCNEGLLDEASSLIATNIFVLEDGNWRIVFHQAGPLVTKSTVVRPSQYPHGVN